MFSVTTIREHASRAGNVFTATGRTIPGPLGLLLQLVILILLIVAVVLVALPVLVLGGVFLVGGLLYAGARGLLLSPRLRVRDDGRRNVRVIESSPSDVV
jgi:hypothetical protein